MLDFDHRSVSRRPLSFDIGAIPIGQIGNTQFTAGKILYNGRSLMDVLFNVTPQRRMENQLWTASDVRPTMQPLSKIVEELTGDSLIPIEEIEPDSIAFLMNFRGKPDGNRK